MLFHIYVDSTMFYFSFLPGDEKSALPKLELCLKEIRDWMATNRLKLNGSEMEFTTFGSKTHLSSLPNTSLTIGEFIIDSRNVTSVKSLGAYFDASVKLEAPITAMCLVSSVSDK